MSGLDNITWIKSNNIKPLKGRVLISEPLLLDLYFQRSVVLLLDNEKDGAVGIILNKEIATPFNEIVKDFPQFDVKVYLGGPLAQDSLFFLHNLGNEIPDSEEILPGVFWGGDLNEVSNLIEMGVAKPSNFKFFLGYSSWEPEQLDNEIEQNSWVINTISAKQVFNKQTDNLWKDSIRKLGGEYLYWLNFPVDPSNN
ncbi:MAG: YqgE/AlgH family protein [Bacteroidales bacterium]